jgi:hypothetical protein
MPAKKASKGLAKAVSAKAGDAKQGKEERRTAPKEAPAPKPAAAPKAPAPKDGKDKEERQAKLLTSLQERLEELEQDVDARRHRNDKMMKAIQDKQDELESTADKLPVPVGMLKNYVGHTMRDFDNSNPEVYDASQRTDSVASMECYTTWNTKIVDLVMLKWSKEYAVSDTLTAELTWAAFKQLKRSKTRRLNTTPQKKARIKVRTFVGGAVNVPLTSCLL